MNWNRVLIAAAMFTLTAAAVRAQDLPLEVIQLKYRTADQVIPILQPLLNRQGTISGMQNNLIVRTTPQNLAEIRRILETIDAMPRRLMITVRQDADVNRSLDAAGVSGTISTGNARVVVPGSGGDRGGNAEIRRGDDNLRARVLSTQSLDNDRNTQQVQVLEGNSAFINAGQSIPVPSRSVVRTMVNGRLVEQVVDNVQYRDAVTGFYVLPRLSGDRVTLEVSPQRDTLGNQGPGSVNIQRASTTVSGQLGEWIELGGIVSGGSSEERANISRTVRVGGDNRRILVRVDEVR
jgi:type II secretory pathway component GspD/PulD (secretin)